MQRRHVGPERGGQWCTTCIPAAPETAPGPGSACRLRIGVLGPHFTHTTCSALCAAQHSGNRPGRTVAPWRRRRLSGDHGLNPWLQRRTSG